MYEILSLLNIKLDYLSFEHNQFFEFVSSLPLRNGLNFDSLWSVQSRQILVHLGGNLGK